MNETGLMTTGQMATGLTNCATGGDPAIEGRFCASDAVERALSCTAPETAASEPSLAPDSDPSVAANADSWRSEVAARLERYRTRRKPRTPRYPSLLLPFEAPESWSRPAPPTGSVAVAAVSARAEQDFAFDLNQEPQPVAAPTFAERRPTSQPSQEPGPELSAKVIEFPRSAAIPVSSRSELADPIFDRPRIVEAPEILPQPPALGGMLMEPAQQEPADRRASADFPCASASIARRSLAALVDGAVLATALAAFAAIFFRLNPIRGPLPVLAVAFGLVAVLLWMAYDFLFVVYTGSTPGLRAARLGLAAFDGSPLNRRVRRWRVLASFLSAFSAGLGYFWCALDQEGLCWHDRITRTHVQSAPRGE
jgi:uncharacterized RDD family membrane protein YckC